MRTETIEKTYLKFDELNDEQKAKAIGENRDFNTEGLDWWDCVYDDAKEVAKLIGFEIEEIYFRGFWSQGDGACFTGRFERVKSALANVKAYAPQDETLHTIAKEFQDLQRKSFYTATGTISHHGRYYHERSISVDVDAERGATCDDEWQELASDFCSWIYARLEAQHDYLTSDECVAESLQANDMEFEA